MPREQVADKHRWLNVLRTQDRSLIKVSELGGDGQDVNFEQAFSNLAHAYLRDKAPGLLDHEVGFQLLDRNQENTKAVGVFGFKVGSNWIYAPVFFLNGDLKGHELLYLKNQDMFCPLKENWLNYILNRKPNILGEGIDKDYRRGLLQPDLTQMSRSPAKFASAKPRLKDMVDAVLPAFAATATLDAKVAFADIGKHVNLVDFLKSASAPIISLFVNTCRECPQLAATVDQFYDAAAVTAAIKTAMKQNRMKAAGSILDPAPKPRPAIVTGDILDTRRPHPIKSGALKVITPNLTTQTDLPPGTTEEDQEKLMKDRVLIKDKRDDEDVSRAYHVRVEQKLQNPTQTGLYQVLTKTGEFEKCLVVVHPLGADRKKQFVTVVRLDGEKNWCNTGDQVWVGDYLDDDWAEWFEKLPEAKTLSKGRSRFMVIAPGRDATCPFRVEREYGKEGDESSVYEVDFDDYDAGVQLASYKSHRKEEEDYITYDRWRDGQRLHLNGKQGTALRASRGDVFVPEGSKLLEVRHDAYDDEEHDEDEALGCVPCSSGSGSSDPPPVRPGSIIDAQLSIMQKTSSLSIYNDGVEVEINRKRMSPLNGLVTLVADHGFREHTARELLKQAAEKRKITVRVKYASPYLTDSQPSGPSIPEAQMGGDFMGANVPTQYEGNDFRQVDRPPSNREAYNPNTTLDRNDVSKIRRAAGTGQKEIFDTAMVGSMLKAVRDDTMVDQYLGDLTKGMDRLGRILFMFYWHGDRFADRYGKSDMPELEDSLRNSFESVGDVLMFLKQKSIEPYPEESDVSVDLGPAANS